MLRLSRKEKAVKKLLIACLVVTLAGPAMAMSENAGGVSSNAGGVNGNGVATGDRCYSPLPLMSPNYFADHDTPCWAGAKWR